MARTREIKRRIGAVWTIRRITKTMQMVATAKFTTAVLRDKASAPYTFKINRLVAEALSASSDFSHPLMASPAESPKRERMLVISSTRGLCGAYNAGVLRAAWNAIGRIQADGRALEVETAGKKAVGFLRFHRISISRRHLFGDKPAYDDIERLAQRYIDDFTSGQLDSVLVAFMRFESTARQVPEVIKLLPLEPAASEVSETDRARALYDFSPSTDAILTDLLPLAVKTALFQAFLDAAVSEQVMRMVAMRAATENASELHKTLTRRFNRARQTRITTELMEVISGAAALN